MLLETIKLALTAIWRNALRSVLTLLGVMIGVAAVIALVTLGQGTTAEVSNSISSLGSNLLVLRPGQMSRGPTAYGIPAFKMTDGTRTYGVVYRGITPDTFTDSVDVVVEGRLGHDQVFHATTLLAKCASRYENAPDRPARVQT